MRAALFAVGLLACTGADKGASGGGDSDGGDSRPSARDPLVLSHDGWRLADPGDDPFPPEQPVDCPAVAYGVENGFFELETDYCAWATFRQSTRSDLYAGERLEVVTWHLDLWAPDPYVARIVLRLDDTNLWEAEFEVPGSEDVAELQLEVPEDLPAGTNAWFHLANHGVNSWRLGDVERMP